MVCAYSALTGFLNHPFLDILTEQPIDKQVQPILQPLDMKKYSTSTVQPSNYLIMVWVRPNDKEPICSDRCFFMRIKGFIVKPSQVLWFLKPSQRWAVARQQLTGYVIAAYSYFCPQGAD